MGKVIKMEVKMESKRKLKHHMLKWENCDYTFDFMYDKNRYKGFWKKLQIKKIRNDNKRELKNAIKELD